MENNSLVALQAVRDILLASGFEDDVDHYTQLFLARIYLKAFDIYLENSKVEEREQLRHRIQAIGDESARIDFIVQVFEFPEHARFLQSAAEQVASEFTRIVNQSA